MSLARLGKNGHRQGWMTLALLVVGTASAVASFPFQSVSLPTSNKVGSLSTEILCFPAIHCRTVGIEVPFSCHPSSMPCRLSARRHKTSLSAHPTLHFPSRTMTKLLKVLIDTIRRPSAAFTMASSITSSCIQSVRGGSIAELSAKAAAASAAAERMVITDELLAATNDWLMNLGGPAALVAGAVVATLYENIKSGDLEIREGNDKRTVTIMKKCTKLLLLSAFAFEVICIFVSMVTGTMLVSQSADMLMAIKTTTSATANEVTDMALEAMSSATPLSFLRTHFEFEYLICRITFLQGLLNWMAAIALGHAIPSDGETEGTRRLNQFVSWSIGAVIILMLSFYNTHMTFYNNYFHMIERFAEVVAVRFLLRWPPRPLMMVFFAFFSMSLSKGYLAFRDLGDETTKATPE
jgi:hypothetical protein